MLLIRKLTRHVLGNLAKLALLLLIPSAASHGQAQPRPPTRPVPGQGVPASIGRDQFLARGNLNDLQLSPNGRQVAYLSRSGQEPALWILQTSGGPARIIRASDARRLYWSRDSRWLFLESRARVSVLNAASPTEPVAMINVGGDSGRAVFAPDPINDAALLFAETAPGEAGMHRLVRITADGVRTVLHEDRREILDFALNSAGEVAFMKFAAGDHNSIEQRRADGSLTPVMRCVRLETCVLLSVTRDGHLLMQADVQGNLQRLVRISSTGRAQTLQQDPRGVADISDIVFDRVLNDPVIVTFRSTGPRNVGLTREARRVLALAERSLGHANFTIAPATGTGAQWLVVDRGDRLQFPRYYLIDPRRARVREILADLSVSPIPAAALSVKRPISFRASDGRIIHGFISLPPGRPTATLPLVVAVHGGPWANIGPGYNPMTQFLTSRGYAVFEPNFRGSTGYGRAYMFAANGDFGNGRVQQDIIEGTRNLLRLGIGDPARVAITGVSFGGYSSLLGVTFEPDLFKTAIAISPPTDFGTTVRMGPGIPDPLQDGIPLSARLRFQALGDPEVAARLSAQSPAANAARLNRPIYILAGERDRLVPIAAIRTYVDGVRTSHRDVRLVIDPQGGHGPTTPMGQQAYLYLLELALHQHLAGPAPAPPSAELAEFLGAIADRR
jgi:dipeptidyl aminopeptidase/acylaminoacyl peptidase